MVNECYRRESAAGPVFVKTAPARDLEMFTAEAAGLEALRGANAVRIPRVLGLGCGAVVHVGTDVRGSSANGDERAWLALEWVEAGTPTRKSEALLGEQLARQHRVTQSKFGWCRDNTIGRTPQLNAQCADWVTFYRDLRLRYQLDLAASNGFDLREQGEVLLDRLPGFFKTHEPAPSLLHGDLWGGNWLTDERGQPVIFDPAVYYGDREADIAMTRLFGGYGRDFYAAYEAAWPLDAGYQTRTDLYNLYHVLNHLNLLGAGYLGQATSMIGRLLAQVPA
jgi:protein-ribulosamine 3-kinase